MSFGGSGGSVPSGWIRRRHTGLPTRLHRLNSRSRSLFPLAILTLLIFAVLLAGCGSMSTPSMTPPPLGPTAVTLLLSSTANDQFSAFNIDIASVTLANKAGATLNLMPATQIGAIFQTQNGEFIHLNGAAASLLTALVPQDVYTSATLTYTYSQFTYLTLDSMGGIISHIDAVGELTAIPQSASVNLPSPITISGTAMGLSLNLQVFTSAASTGCSLTIPALSAWSALKRMTEGNALGGLAARIGAILTYASNK